ncbi:hypothetical protein IAE22_30020, partial [Bacillus sp. S34]|nr:hypothetical protein [Bacillus sp. S34]
MQCAQAVLDTLAAHVEDSGFGARGLHVLVGIGGVALLVGGIAGATSFAAALLVVA